MVQDGYDPMPWRLVGRALGFGAVCGAVLGVASVAVLLLPAAVTDPWGLGFVVVCAPYATVIGGVVGTVVGLFGGLMLVMTGADRPGNQYKVRPVAGAAAAAPILALAMWTFALDSQDWPWVIGGWLWWLAVAVMSAATGAAVGPRVVGGRSDRLHTGSDRLPTTPYHRRGCRFPRRTALG